MQTASSHGLVARRQGRARPSAFAQCCRLCPCVPASLRPCVPVSLRLCFVPAHQKKTTSVWSGGPRSRTSSRWGFATTEYVRSRGKSDTCNCHHEITAPVAVSGTNGPEEKRKLKKKKSKKKGARKKKNHKKRPATWIANEVAVPHIKSGELDLAGIWLRAV